MEGLDGGEVAQAGRRLAPVSAELIRVRILHPLQLAGAEKLAPGWIGFDTASGPIAAAGHIPLASGA